MKISLRHRHALTIVDGAFSHKIDVVTDDSKSQRISKLQYWFKSYGIFAEWVDFAHWWSFIGKGLCLQPAQQACFPSISTCFLTGRSQLESSWGSDGKRMTGSWWTGSHRPRFFIFYQQAQIHILNFEGDSSWLPSATRPERGNTQISHSPHINYIVQYKSY